MIFKKNFKKKVSHFTHLLLTNFLFPISLKKKKKTTLRQLKDKTKYYFVSSYSL